MDVKIKGITDEIFQQVLKQGEKAKQEILAEMEQTLSGPRPELSPLAPRITVLEINPEKIREVVGPGGKMINKIIAETGASIDIEQTGKIFITAESETAVKKTVDWIKDITREAKVGEIFRGKVKKILEFGAFVEILPGVTGLIHISQLAPFRVGKVEDIVKLGDTVTVKVISIDEQGRVNLSLKEAK
jgi:polyribonucleotide nucleotidyltransferase